MYEHHLMGRMREIVDALRKKGIDAKVEPRLSEYQRPRMIGDLEIAGIPFLVRESRSGEGRMDLSMGWPLEPSYGVFTDGEGTRPEISVDPHRDPEHLASDIMRRLVNVGAPRYAKALEARDRWVKSCADAWTMADALAKVQGEVREAMGHYFVESDIAGVRVSVSRTRASAKFEVWVDKTPEAREVYAAILAALKSTRSTTQGDA